MWLTFQVGIDKIDLSTINARVATQNDQAFTWRNTATFVVNTTANSGLHYFYNAATDTTVVEASNDTDVAAEFLVVLTGNIALIATDFIL